MALSFSYFHFSCGLSAILIALMYIYPIIFYIFLFILYSLILVICGESSTCIASTSNSFIADLQTLVYLLSLFAALFFQYNKSKPNVMKPVQASEILYNATRWDFTRFVISNIYDTRFDFRSRMFDVPKRSKANLSVIFGRTVDKLLQQFLENALNDFIHSWLRWGSCHDRLSTNHHPNHISSPLTLVAK